MRILVTGSAGLVGSACTEQFRQEGHEVVGIDSNMRSRFFGVAESEVEVSIDIRNRIEVEELVQQGFDAIVHTAAQPSHDYATEHVLEDFDVNARGTLILLEATRQFSPQATFIHISTDKVYGENMSCTLVEDDTRLIPKSDYFKEGFTEELELDFAGDRSFFGCSKAAADLYAQQYAARGMKVMVFRPGCITGSAHKGAEQHGFLSYLAKCVKEETIYKIYGFQGKQVRDQIHAADFATAISECVKNPHPGAVFNIGGGPDRAVSVLEAGEMIALETGKVFDYTFEPQRKGDRPWDVHNITRFRKAYPEWNYDYSLKDIIRDLCEN